MSKPSLRAAIVGLGNVAWGYPAAAQAGRATTHLASYRALGIACVAGCDVNAKAARKFTAATGIRAHAGLKDLLRAERIDILSVCSPDAAHFGQVRLALESGVRRIWLEKAPAGTAAQTRELAELARRRGATVAVNFFRRYHRAYEMLKDIVKRETLGRVRRIRLQYSLGLRANGIHQLDLLHFVTGDGKAFSVDAASGADLNPDALLRRGALQVLVCGADVPFHVQETEVLCERGRVRVTQGGAALWMDRAIPNPDYPGFSRLEPATGPELSDANPGDGFPAVLADLIAAYEQKRRPRSHLGTALRAMQLYEDIMKRAHGNPRRRG